MVLRILLIMLLAMPAHAWEYYDRDNGFYRMMDQVQKNTYQDPAPTMHVYGQKTGNLYHTGSGYYQGNIYNTRTNQMQYVQIDSIGNIQITDI